MVLGVKHKTAVFVSVKPGETWLLSSRGGATKLSECFTE